jgi:hypothetical protein
MVKHITTETIQELFLTTTPKSIGIADLGCSSGPNTLATIKDIVKAVEGTSPKMLLHPPPEFRVYLNDLPTNDFNSIFKTLPEFYSELRKEKSGGCPSIFIGGYAGSFYGRLFPNNCLHFVYSSYSLHWLSRVRLFFFLSLFECMLINHYIVQVPPAIYDEKGKSINKGHVYISEFSPPQVSQAYYKQFQEDFRLFLGSRSEELIVGGRMVLILLGRIGLDHVDRGNSFFWQLLSRSLTKLISKVFQNFFYYFL